MAKKGMSYETIFNPAFWIFRTCRNGHALAAGDRIIISLPDDIDDKSLVIECAACFSTWPDGIPKRPRESFHAVDEGKPHG